MDILSSLGHVNWLSVLVAAVGAFAIGSLWYSPVLFSKIWQKEINLPDDKLKSANMPLIFGVAFVLEFIAAVVLDMFIGPGGTLASGIKLGALVSIGWVATSIGTNYLFGQRSFKLFAIDAGYFVVFFIAMGAILGAW